MQLKNLEIKHEQYYNDKPTGDKYTGKVAFFNNKGENITIVLRQDQLAGIVELCAAGIVLAAKEASASIVTSLRKDLQIEQSVSCNNLSNEE